MQHSITNCEVCHHIFHDSCGIEGYVRKCCASMSNDYCVICTGSCQWKKHKNRWHKYDLRDATETTTVDNLLKKMLDRSKINTQRKKCG